MLFITRERVTAHLLEISGLINLYQKREPLFLEKMIKWLSQVETDLLELRNPLAGFVSGARGKVLAVHDGYRDPQLIGSKLSKRKASVATATLVLSQVESRLNTLVSEIDTKFDAWREKMSQLIALASMKCPIPLPSTEPRQVWLKQVWAQLGRSQEAKGMYGYLNAAMLQADRMHMLDELTQNMSSALMGKQSLGPEPEPRPEPEPEPESEQFRKKKDRRCSKICASLPRLISSAFKRED